MAVSWNSYLLISALYASSAWCQFQGGVFKPNLNYNPGGDPSHQGGNLYGGGILAWNTNNNQLTRPCIPIPCMIKHCDLGFKTGPGGCQYCLCNQRPVPTTPSPYQNPCAGQPLTCDASCNGNYETGTNGCQYCRCSGSVSTTQAVSTTPSPDACLDHITRCQIRCPYGFMTDNIQCDMCVCKDEIYKVASVPPERQPLVILSNPCIQGLDRCMIACASGYRTGARSCQYCACQQ